METLTVLLCVYFAIGGTLAGVYLSKHLEESQDTLALMILSYFLWPVVVYVWMACATSK